MGVRMQWAATAAILAIAPGCVACSDGEVPDAAPSTSAPTATAARSVELHPDGTAAQNRAFFDQTNRVLVAKNPMPGGKAVIDGLVAAGFDVKQMEVSPDKTSIGLDAEAIYFSVKFGTQCLIGQISSAFGYRSIRADALDSGTCLVGTTRTIDWVDGG